MKTINKLLAISSRLDHLKNSADWITKESVHLDNTITQTSTLINVLAEEIRGEIYELVRSLENDVQKATDALEYH